MLRVIKKSAYAIYEWSQRERERERDAYYKYNRGSNRDSRDGRNRDRSPKDRKSWQDHRGGRHQVQDRGGGKFLS